MPGVVCGDIGPKLGYSSKDNGFLAFDNVRVGTDALLSRYIKIKGGKVELRGNPKVGYASMMIMRKILCETYTRMGGVSLTIAIRYSIIRKQFKDQSGKELSVLDYQL
jgi:acyl-CoA oxidase